MPIVADVMSLLEELAPPAIAADWDNTGLLLGSPDDPAVRIMTCLTITPEVVAEAVAENVQLIVSHHPVLFRGTKNLSTRSAEGRLLLPLLRAGVAVYSPHTAWDDAPGGINDSLAKRLNLSNTRPLVPINGKPGCKLVVFVPDNDLAKVSDALFAVGAGIIGQYKECSFRQSGTGTFFGLESTNPVVGQKGRREEVPEWRLEVVVPEGKVDAAIQAMRAAHSYEEVAFDVYPLRANRIGGTGRVGELPSPRSLRDLAGQLQNDLSASGVNIVGAPETLIQRVAIVCGSGGKLIPDALRAKADCFLTGEATFHDCLTAKAAGMSLILPGHYASERFGLEELASVLAKRLPLVQVWASQREQDVLSRV